VFVVGVVGVGIFKGHGGHFLHAIRHIENTAVIFFGMGGTDDEPRFVIIHFLSHIPHHIGIGPVCFSFVLFPDEEAFADKGFHLGLRTGNDQFSLIGACAVGMD